MLLTFLILQIIIFCKKKSQTKNTYLTGNLIFRFIYHLLSVYYITYIFIYFCDKILKYFIFFIKLIYPTFSKKIIFGIVFSNCGKWIPVHIFTYDTVFLGIKFCFIWFWGWFSLYASAFRFYELSVPVLRTHCFCAWYASNIKKFWKTVFLKRRDKKF